ncbi:GNAT family N-acetyltransferase [Afipia sp. GAS231]|uniref:GNAT family N-acetyltransferase n=1 Tax=Afipia sp. GAS231 TaxID=1882747 RepID=UPI000879ACB2|nr:GNAT family N-acetyltransferase [Afipia sp. GAS231]SDN82425.1 translation initiation factor 4G [Afipia sp. GAS231]
MPTIRPARAEDAGFIARNILSSQRGPKPRGWFDVALGWPEPQCLAFVERIATARQRSWWHVSHFLVAEVDGEPAASLCALPAAGIGVAVRAAITEVAGQVGLNESELAAIFRRGAYSSNCWVQGGEGEWLLEHVATLPAYRGRGLVQGLIQHALDRGRAAGFSRASISFLIGNDQAERSYAKAGFTFAEEKRDPDFEALTGAPGFRRFVRAI